MTTNRTSADSRPGLELELLPDTYGICRMRPKARLPRWLHRSSFFSISRSSEELSIVCDENLIPDDLRCERGWRAIKVLGPLDFSLIGVLDSLARPLAAADVSIFAISTFDTDYLLVRATKLRRAISTLEGAGHRFEGQRSEKASDKSARKPVEENDTTPHDDENEGSFAEKPPKKRRRRRKKSKRDPQKVDQPDREDQDREDQDRGDQGREDRDREDRETEKRPTRKKTGRSRPTHKLQPDEVQEDSAPRVSDSASGDTSPDDAESPAPQRTNRVVKALSDLFTSVRSSPSRPDTATEAVDKRSQPSQDEAPDEKDEQQSMGADAEEHQAAKPKRRRRRRRRPSRAEKPSADQESDVQEQVAEEKSEAAHQTPKSSTDEGDDADGLYTGAIPQHEVEVTEGSFAALGLSAPILATIRKVGFEHPTPVQAGVIPHALKGHDVVGLAETGSGKTAAFCLPLAERLTHGRGIRGLILCPTREIALQTKAFLDIFGRDHALETVSVIGGVKMGPQIKGFQRRADILVATPGRLADHLRRRNLRLDELEELVLDEADHMLDLGFLPQIREILEEIPGPHRTMMFSATMPPPIERLAQMFMKDPVTVDFRPEGHVASGIEHRLYLVKEDDQKQCVMALLREIPGSTLIFTRRKLHSEWLARQLEIEGFAATRIHSDRSQAQRVRALRDFREGKHRILVATDVAARGLDIPRIQHVINFALPETTEDYIHRAGRTARGNSAGIVSSIGTWQDKITIQEIERLLGIKIPRHTVEGVEPYVEIKKRKQVRRRRLL